jgi:hypothetical protein
MTMLWARLMTRELKFDFWQEQRFFSSPTHLRGATIKQLDWCSKICYSTNHYHNLFTSSHAELKWTELNWLCPLLITSQHGPHRKHGSSIVASSCYTIKNLLHSNRNMFTKPLPYTVAVLESLFSNESICQNI